MTPHEQTVADRIAAALRAIAPGGSLQNAEIPLINQIATLWAKRMPQARRINAAGLSLIKEFEGLRTTAYRDPVGIWTIGYGSTSGVHEGQRITVAEAELMLKRDLEQFERAVANAAPTATDNQFSAMVSLAFNVGSGAFSRSTVLTRHKGGDHAGAADAFSMWNKAGGRVLPGLVRRRAAEADLYRRAS